MSASPSLFDTVAAQAGSAEALLSQVTTVPAPPGEELRHSALEAQLRSTSSNLLKLGLGITAYGRLDDYGQECYQTFLGELAGAEREVSELYSPGYRELLYEEYHYAIAHRISQEEFKSVVRAADSAFKREHPTAETFTQRNEAPSLSALAKLIEREKKIEEFIITYHNPSMQHALYQYRILNRQSSLARDNVAEPFRRLSRRTAQRYNITA